MAAADTIDWPEWFGVVPRRALAALAAGSAHRRYPTASVMFMEGDPGHHVVVIQRGNVKVVTTARDGRETVLDVLGPPSVLGELAALDGRPRSATAVALTPVHAAVIPAETFRAVGRQHPELLEALLVEIGGRLRVSDQRQLEFGGDALGRVCARLLEIVERQGSGAEVTLPVSQSELAAWTGLSREAVVKALGALRRLGWAQTSGRRVTLLDAEEIRRRATA